MKPAVFCLMGPTASGKTDVAVELVQQANIQIISVDSAQVYRGMDIGTGKPDSEMLARAPHRLIDIRDPTETYSASEFRDDAVTEIEEVLQQGATPLLVGGTMLYFRTLRDGLAELPRADPEIRAEIEEQALAFGWDSVHSRLAKVDPISAARIHSNDPQRLQRALEVYLLTGKPLSELHQEGADSAEPHGADRFQYHWMAIQPASRAVLHERIASRFVTMLERGLVLEVEKLFYRGDLNHRLPSMKSVGYRQVWQYLADEIGYDDMVERGIIATRQLAKRQLTWLRSWENLQSLGDPSADSIAKSVEKALNYVDSIVI